MVRIVSKGPVACDGQGTGQGSTEHVHMELPQAAPAAYDPRYRYAITQHHHRTDHAPVAGAIGCAGPEKNAVEQPQSNISHLAPGPRGESRLPQGTAAQPPSKYY